MRTRSCTSTRTASWAKAMTLAAVAILILDLASALASAQSPDWAVARMDGASLPKLAADAAMANLNADVNELSATAGKGRSDSVPEEILVGFHGGALPAQVEAVRGGLGAVEIKTIPQIGVHHWRLPPGLGVSQAIQRLKGNPNVRYAEPNWLYSYLYASDPLDPGDPSFVLRTGWPFGYQEHLQHDVFHNNPNVREIHAEEAWDNSPMGAGAIVAVCDSGVDLDHPDLDGNLVPGKNFIRTTKPPQDDVGHGTHVAGIIAAEINNYGNRLLGTAALNPLLGDGVVGVAPAAKIMPVKVGDANGVPIDKLVQGIIWAADNGAHIINMSLGGGFSQTVQDAVTYAYGRNVLIVAAAGNSSAESSLYPAACAYTLSVAAVTSGDLLASFSNYGWSVDVSAPGVNILSTVIDGDSTKWVSGGYARMSGTSMASPVAAGVAALIKSKYPTMSAADVGGQLLATADDINSDNPGYETKLGAGRVDAFGAVSGASAPVVIGAKTEGSDHGVFGDLQISVKFSHAMNAASVLYAGNYGLLWAGDDGILGTGDDVTVALSMASTAYESFPGQGVQIVASGAPDGNYRFTASSNIQSAAGQPLTAFMRELAWAKSPWTNGIVLADARAPAALAYDPMGQPAIAFYGDLDKDSYKDTARFARWNGATWVFETIGPAVGGITLVYDGAGNPSVSFFSSDLVLKFARRSGSSWTIVSVDSNVVAYDTSLAYDPAGNPSISYCVRVITGKGKTVTTYYLKFARWNGSAWVTQVVEAGVPAQYNSLAYGPDGNPSIAYSGGDSLKMAHWNGSSWDIQVIEAGVPGNSVSLAYDPLDHNPSVVHYVSGDIRLVGGDIRFLHWNGSWQASSFSAPTGGGTRLVYDALGTPYISHWYYDFVQSNYILVTHWDGMAWLTETADRIGGIDGQPSIAIDPLTNTPSVAYGESFPGWKYNMKFAKRAP